MSKSGRHTHNVRISDRSIKVCFFPPKSCMVVAVAHSHTPHAPVCLNNLIPVQQIGVGVVLRLFLEQPFPLFPDQRLRLCIERERERERKRLRHTERERETCRERLAWIIFGPREGSRSRDWRRLVFTSCQGVSQVSLPLFTGVTMAKFTFACGVL